MKKNIKDISDLIENILDNSITFSSREEIESTVKYILRKNSKKRRFKNIAKKTAKKFVEEFIESGRIYAEANVRHF